MYNLKITNEETGTVYEFSIEELEELLGILRQFDETKIDFELHREEKEKVIKIKM